MAIIIWSISALLLFWEFIIFIFRIISKVPSSSSNYKRPNNYNYSQPVETTNFWKELGKIKITVKPNSDTVHVKGHYRKDGTYVKEHYRKKSK